MKRASPSEDSAICFSSARGARSVNISSTIGASSIASSHGTLLSSLISRRIFVICDMRSVCSFIRSRTLRVSSSTSGCSMENKSICACKSASGVRSSWAALPVNCRWLLNPSSRRSIILLKERQNCRNSGSTSSLTFISDKLSGCTFSI